FETYTLPSNTNGRYVRITVTGNTENNWVSIYELRINGYQSSTLPGPTTNLYDDFDGTAIYTLADGQTSPNAKWRDIYNGHGAAGTQDDGTGSGNKVFFMYPQTSTSPSQTSASLAVSTQTWPNFDMSMDVKTVKQLRQNSPPNPWETAWVFFRYTDTFHYYAFLVKPNGIEFDKKDCNTCTDPVQGQQFLVTASSPTLKIGTWSNWKISAIGNHIIITVDGNKVIDYIDQTMSPQLARGSIAMYNEDAYAQFDNVYVTPK
ncbi:MAG: family 16 glycoside hydrolase, partial [Nitrososphaeraceae archaeon]